MENIRQRRKQFAHPFFRCGARAIEFGDALLQPSNFLTASFGFFAAAVFHQRADLATRRVALGVKLIRLGDRAPALRIEVCEVIERQHGMAARFERGAHFI
jgi:hypothetical protein